MAGTDPVHNRGSNQTMRPRLVFLAWGYLVLGVALYWLGRGIGHCIGEWLAGAIVAVAMIVMAFALFVGGTYAGFMAVARTRGVYRVAALIAALLNAWAACATACSD